MAEDAERAGIGAVAFLGAAVAHLAQQVEILAQERSGLLPWIEAAASS